MCIEEIVISCMSNTIEMTKNWTKKICSEGKDGEKEKKRSVADNLKMEEG